MSKKESLVAILVLVALLFVLFHVFSSIASSRRGHHTPLNLTLVCNCCVIDYPTGQQLGHPPSENYFKVNGSDYYSIMNLTSVLTSNLDCANITYVISRHTLMGSYLMHRLLPFDDKIELWIHIRELRRLPLIIPSSLHYHTTLPATSNYTAIMRVFRRDSTHRVQKWRWPYVEVRFFDENHSHVWEMLHSARERFPTKVKRTDFYPLHRRPFGNLWLLAPDNAHVCLLARYKLIRYEEYMYEMDGRTELKLINPPEKWLPLRYLYPRVYRRTCDGNGTLERWTRGGHRWRDMTTARPADLQQPDQYSVHVPGESYPCWTEGRGLISKPC